MKRFPTVPRAWQSVSFLFCIFGQNFAKFWSEKYDLDLYTGFYMEKMTQIRQISKNFNSRSPDFYDKVPLGSQEYRKILFFFLLSYLICSQIWLNHLMDNHHLCYITKLKKRTLIISYNFAISLLSKQNNFWNCRGFRNH